MYVCMHACMHVYGNHGESGPLLRTALSLILYLGLGHLAETPHGVPYTPLQNQPG